jgi:hypothetical protein
MDFSHLFTPEKAGIQTATAAGSLVALLTTRKYAWAHALTLFMVGQITAFYWTVPIAETFKWGTEYYGPVGFFIGAVGMLIWGGIIALGQNLSQDPMGTLTWAFKLWRRDKE